MTQCQFNTLQTNTSYYCTVQAGEAALHVHMYMYISTCEMLRIGHCHSHWKCSTHKLAGGSISTVYSCTCSVFEFVVCVRVLYTALRVQIHIQITVYILTVLSQLYSIAPGRVVYTVLLVQYICIYICHLCTLSVSDRERQKASDRRTGQEGRQKERYAQAGRGTLLPDCCDTCSDLLDLCATEYYSLVYRVCRDVESVTAPRQYARPRPLAHSVAMARSTTGHCRYSLMAFVSFSWKVSSNISPSSSR